MLAELTNHLWQSSVFGIALGILTLAFRGNRAHVRYWMWLAASLKFLLPFVVLIGLGRHLEWRLASRTISTPSVIALSMVQISEPFGGGAAAVKAVREAHNWPAVWIFGVWAAVFATIAAMRVVAWIRIRNVVRVSTPMDIDGDIQIRASDSLLEPGAVGFFRPVVLLPAGITERLEPAQLQAVLAHEFCHVRRRDNLTAAMHMVVEAVFWFHPLVWWIGARLVEERERACDEKVLSLGNEPGDYAAGILNVCKSYMKAPLACVTGVSCANVKQRIQAILKGCQAFDLTPAKKLALAGFGLMALSLPFAVGVVSAPRIRAQTATATPKFEVVSIRTCSAFRKSTVEDWAPGTLHSECTTTARLIQQAYGLFADGRMDPGSAVAIDGGPAWTRSDLYEIDAKAQDAAPHTVMNGPVLAAILEWRFSLKLHVETRQAPSYAVRASAGAAKLQPFAGACNPRDFNKLPAPSDCAVTQLHKGGFDLAGATLADLCAGLSVLLDRHVIDESGIQGRYNLRLELSAEDNELLKRPRALPAVSDPTAPTPPPISFAGVKKGMAALGLDLVESQGPGEFLVIDAVERPSTN